MLRKVYRCKECAGWIIPDIFNSTNAFVPKCTKCNKSNVDIVESVENINFIYSIRNNNDAKLLLRFNESILTFENEEIAKSFLNDLPKLFKKDAIVTVHKDYNYDIKEVVMNVTNGLPITVEFKSALDCRGRLLLQSEEVDIINAERSYGDLGFVTLDDVDAQHIYRWMEHLLTITGKDDIIEYGNKVSIAFERLYDRIAKGFYHKKTSQDISNAKICDKIPEDYKDKYTNHVKLCRYIGESDINFTKDKLYFVEISIENNERQYWALNNKHEFVRTDIIYFDIEEERFSFI